MKGRATIGGIPQASTFRSQMPVTKFNRYTMQTPQADSIIQGSVNSEDELKGMATSSIRGAFGESRGLGALGTIDKGPGLANKLSTKER